MDGASRRCQGERVRPDDGTYHRLQLPADADCETLLPCQVRHEPLVLAPQVAVHERDGYRVDPLALELVELFREGVGGRTPEHSDGLSRCCI